MTCVSFLQTFKIFSRPENWKSKSDFSSSSGGATHGTEDNSFDLVRQGVGLVGTCMDRAKLNLRKVP